MKIVYVSAAILIDEDSNIFIAQRPQGKTMHGLWEFPGGKIEEGETPQQALIREMREEVGIEIGEPDLKPFTFVTHPGDGFFLVMFLFTCRRWHGKPRGCENQVTKWISKTDLERFEFPPADRPILALLRTKMPPS